MNISQKLHLKFYSKLQHIVVNTNRYKVQLSFQGIAF